MGGSWDGSIPTPKALGAGVNRRSYSKTLVAVEKDAVQEVGLASSVETRHCNN